jgi:type II secretory pathway pseudopilin PulG
MAPQDIRGFTIIELLLFLSISGLLFVALMTGVSTSINQQRYRDSVTSLSGLLQQQYSEVANTRNDRDNNWTCDASTVTQDETNGQVRGTSSCVVLGRYIRTVDNGSQLEIGDVIGSQPDVSGDTTVDGDIAALAAYNPKTSPIGQTTNRLEWGATLHDITGHSANFALLIVRSPVSGLIRAFVLPSGLPSVLSDMITKDTAAQPYTACVAADSWSFGPTQAVVISPATAGANGVEVKGDNNGC